MNTLIPVAVLIGLIVELDRWIYGPKPWWAMIFDLVVMIVMGGGIAVGYFAWWMDLTLKGIVPTPRLPWSVSIVRDTIFIETKRLWVLIPTSRVRRYTMICDDNFDKLRGLEDQTLIIYIAPFGRVLVPASSDGFDQMLSIIRAQWQVTVRVIE
jgi:hypothetical protein